MAEQYLPDAEYNRLVATVRRIATAVPSLRIKPSAWTGTITDDEVKIALGEELDLWPESIRGDVERTAVLDAEIEARQTGH